MLTLFFWLIFGVLGGWTVALVAYPDGVGGRTTLSGIIGAVGGLIGGALTHYALHKSFNSGFDGGSILGAVVAAVLLASVYNFILRKYDGR